MIRLLSIGKQLVNSSTCLLKQVLELAKLEYIIMKNITKQQVFISPKDKQKTLEQFFRYFELSGLLFDRNREEIYDVSDIPVDNKFYKLAQQMAKRLNIKWKGMSHEDSNRIMLAMLEDAFNMIRDIENSKNMVIKTTIQILKSDE